MNDLSLPQEFDHVVDVRVVAQTQDIVIGDPGFLLCRQILCQIGDQVALDCHARRIVREAGRRRGIDACRMVDKIRIKTSRLDLLIRQIAGQLIDDGADHFQMAQLLRADIGQKALQLRIRHGKPLAEIAQGCAQFAVRPAVLRNNQRRQFGIGLLDPDGILQFLLIDKHYFSPPSAPSQGHGSLTQVYFPSGEI